VIYVSGEVENVFVQFVFNFFFAFFGYFIEFVAVVIVIVRLPVSITYPAEFVSAAAGFFSACHMVAALVFLDVLVTRWALLCVYCKPLYVFAFAAIFPFPAFDEFAEAWSY
jgi:hypothetical protein